MGRNNNTKTKATFNKHITYRPATHEGYRSRFEWQIAMKLEQEGKAYEYEKHVLRYIVPEKGHRYTPDFKIAGTDFYIEVKGLFDSDDRKKHILLKEQGSDEIRFVFYDANKKISKRSKTTYANWCDKHGFKWSHRVIPEGWLNENK